MNETPAANCQLQAAYQAEYKKLRRMLRRDVRPGSERDAVLMDLHTLLQAAQQEQKLPESIYGGGFSDFYDELLQAMPSAYTQKERDVRRLVKSLACIAVALIALSAALCVYYWHNGTFGVWAQGLEYVATAGRYTVEDTAVEGEYTLALDLRDLDENTGKILYEDGGCSITVQQVRQENSGNYIVFFRAHGVYPPAGGRLVSAAADEAMPGGSLGVRTTGRLLTEVGGMVYPGAVHAATMIRKEGNEFSFYVFDPQSFDRAALEVALEQSGGEVTVRLGGLARMAWTAEH